MRVAQGWNLFLTGPPSFTPRAKRAEGKFGQRRAKRTIFVADTPNRGTQKFGIWIPPQKFAQIEFGGVNPKTNTILGREFPI